MKAIALRLTLSLLALSVASFAQTRSSNHFAANAGPTDPTAASGVLSRSQVTAPATPGPFSRLAFGGGISPLGINLQAAVNANRYINLRAIGNVFNYSVNNFATSGMNLNGKLNFATAGASVDFYPFPNHGFRVSPGTLFYNQNTLTADLTVAGGTSFTLNNVTYYASGTNPITGNGSLGLNTQNPAFTITTGWGNMAPRNNRHWSFPFEIGAAMIGAPSVNVALTGGQACDAQGLNCVDVATDPNVQANLQAQVAKYRNDVNSFRFLPILTFGTAYSFNIRGTR